MFTTGTKFLLGATVAALIGTLLYGLTQDGTLGTIGLVSATVVLAVIAGLNIYTRDANIAADDDAMTGIPAAQGRPGSSIWPMVFALGATTIVLGLVTQQTFFVIGVIILVAGGAEWMVQAWAERASTDSRYSAEVRERLAHALEFPLAGAIGVGALVYAFSRMMLWTSKVTTVVVFSVAAAVIIAVAAGITFAGRKASRRAIAAICAVGAIGVVAGGAAAGIDGERDIHVHETTKGLAAEGVAICDSTESFEADEKASQTVALKSNAAANVTLTEDDRLAFNVPGPIESGAIGLTLPRSNPSNIIFRNESNEERRLSIDLGTTTIEEDGEEVEIPARLCTTLVEPGGAQLLTLTLGAPSIALENGYRFFVPGTDAELGVYVP